MKVLVIGHLTKDVIIKGSERFERVGGGVYYSALALVTFGEVSILTKIGEDFPKEKLYELENCGIKVIALPSKQTTTYELRYLNEGERVLKLLARGEEMKPEELPELGGFDVVLANPVAGEIPKETLEILKNGELALDLQGIVREFKDGVRIGKIDSEVLRGVKILHADINEILSLGSFEKAIQILKENVEVALISNGGERGIAIKKGQIYAYYPPRTKIKDATGAGDTFLAAFTYFYRECPFIQALKMANAFTALFLERRSYDFSMEEVSKKAMEVRVERV
ncbi:hypothetical protein PAP_05985 [Palaeococcus pacificus DY20341]|uniref:Carbohydrate kinase PfkB domain-containing protein n=1 Tax=Palaeococcus pacificus DY20341 TaxID=1343739 RepID=A0A075LUE9_9EURY|nr:PfkB family carbohydrate kinase [Palaeococcus pacificus]AIF69597.1 hypothetical protein PAP_05985 [Palaeococcus pacificus DY20341]